MKTLFLVTTELARYESCFALRICRGCGRFFFAGWQPLILHVGWIFILHSFDCTSNLKFVCIWRWHETPLRKDFSTISPQKIKILFWKNLQMQNFWTENPSPRKALKCYCFCSYVSQSKFFCKSYPRTSILESSANVFFFHFLYLSVHGASTVTEICWLYETLTCYYYS